MIIILMLKTVRLKLMSQVHNAQFYAKQAYERYLIAINDTAHYNNDIIPTWEQLNANNNYKEIVDGWLEVGKFLKEQLEKPKTAEDYAEEAYDLFVTTVGGEDGSGYIFPKWDVFKLTRYQQKQVKAWEAIGEFIYNTTVFKPKQN